MSQENSTAYAAAKARLEQARREREAAELALRQQEEQKLKAIIDADANALKTAVKSVVEADENAQALLTDYSLVIYHSQGGSIEGPAGFSIELVKRDYGKGRKSARPSSNGNGNGATSSNFDITHTRVAIRPETAERLEEALGITLAGDPDPKGVGRLDSKGLQWKSKRKLALYCGVPEENRYADKELVEAHGGKLSFVKADWDDEAFQKSAFETSPDDAKPTDAGESLTSDTADSTPELAGVTA